jgi:sterol desaturase/sphingolipid hydroxylase (fatty acid hydroxylase superfamily)
MGNFATMFVLWDSIFGTNSKYYKEIEKELEFEAEKMKNE